MPKDEKKTEEKQTPLMKQYTSIKARYPDTILFFRMGDFFETFGPDAVTTAKVTGIVLTKRGNGSASEIELAGFGRPLRNPVRIDRSKDRFVVVKPV